LDILLSEYQRIDIFNFMKLFESFDLGGIKLSSRILMAPLTRRRASRDHTPTAIMAEYYGQRAGAGLIIAEGTSPSTDGAGYANMPGLYNTEHMEAWKPVTKEVHENRGLIFLQVMHNGRIGHGNNLPEGGRIIAPSAVQQEGEVTTYDYEKQSYPEPIAMTADDIETAIVEFVQCARMSIEAGFDGIEIHSAHGYLPNQFLNAHTNRRTDQYGGSHENRMRFLLDVLKACSDEIGSKKVGLRISPFSYADKYEEEKDLIELYNALATELNSLDLAYLHLSHMGEPEPVKFKLWKQIRQVYNGTLVLCGDFTKETAEKALLDNEADLIAFGRDFIANPDLVDRFKNNWPLEERDRTNWYTQGEEGYTDYPPFNK
jgi:N-ethylmaleimide reductase